MPHLSREEVQTAGLAIKLKLRVQSRGQQVTPTCVLDGLTYEAARLSISFWPRTVART
jgi:hypothetical protein